MLLNCSSQIHGPVDLALGLGSGGENTNPDLKILKESLRLISTESKTRL